MTMRFPKIRSGLFTVVALAFAVSLLLIPAIALAMFFDDSNGERRLFLFR